MGQIAIGAIATGELATGDPVAAEPLVGTGEPSLASPHPASPGPGSPGSGSPGAINGPGGPPHRPGRSGHPGSPTGRGEAGANRTEAAVFARRWAVLVGVVLLVVIILAIALRGHPPALYWQGEPMQDASQVLVEGQAAMQSVAAADEGALLSASRCYFSLQGSSGHDVAPYLRCGPVLLPWSSPSAPWLTYKLQWQADQFGREGPAGQLGPPQHVGPPSGRGAAPARRCGGPQWQRRPGAARGAPPTRGWAGGLSAPPLGLRPAPLAT